MANPFDAWERMKGFHGAAYNKEATLSTTAIEVELTTPGWWGITASIDFCFTGPFTTTVTATNSTSSHFWAKERHLVYSKASQKISIIAHGTTAGIYRLGLLAGE